MSILSWFNLADKMVCLLLQKKCEWWKSIQKRDVWRCHAAATTKVMFILVSILTQSHWKFFVLFAPKWFGCVSFVLLRSFAWAVFSSFADQIWPINALSAEKCEFGYSFLARNRRFAWTIYCVLRAISRAKMLDRYGNSGSTIFNDDSNQPDNVCNNKPLQWKSQFSIVRVRVYIFWGIAHFVGLFVLCSLLFVDDITQIVQLISHFVIYKWNIGNRNISHFSCNFARLSRIVDVIVGSAQRID